MSEFDQKHFLKTVTTHPGIYQMIGLRDEVLYVGKARNLQKRLSSYFRRTISDPKTQQLVSHIKNILVTITQSENEALLLECSLINKLRPKYNILLRDDKSFPYLYLSPHADFPRLDLYRGIKKGKGQYFGPYPSSGAVRETLNLLQKIFKIRQCADSFFRNRTRPCLQYQIKRCTAPCVGYIEAEKYQENVDNAVLFLQGKNQQIINVLIKKMEEASELKAYEQAAVLRDQVISLRRVQEQQYVTGDAVDTDVIALASERESVCVQVMFIRGGRLIGNKSYFPTMLLHDEPHVVLESFISQYYLNAVRAQAIPTKIITSIPLAEQNWIAATLSEILGSKVSISSIVRGRHRQWLKMAQTNANHALRAHLADKQNYYDRFTNLQTSLRLTSLPQRIECFDVSHTLGEATVASCVVFNQQGPSTAEYRRYNITGITKGDDYAALQQAITRRYIRLKKAEGKLPDILLIDGGKGQLAVAEKALEEIQVSGLLVMSIAKGPGRKAGLESLYLSGRPEELKLNPDSSALHLLQQLRDEAHRFAITAHRKQRAKTRMHSTLQDIPGIGAKKRRELLRQFGGMQEIKRASLEELAKVPGIGLKTAEIIYSALHGD